MAHRDLKARQGPQVRLGFLGLKEPPGQPARKARQAPLERSAVSDPKGRLAPKG